MNRFTAFLLVLAAGTVTAAAGPVEFGNAELERACAGRGLNPRALRIKTEVAADPPESYRIAPGLVTGGDLRGLMYGLLEAADQIRVSGRLRKAAGAPALAVRGVRMVVKDPGAEWFQSREYWPALFRSLALGRFNRFHLALTQLNVEADTLRFITGSAAEFGIDFTLGLWGAEEGQGAGQMQAALAKVLSECPSIRGVQVRMEAETALPAVRAVQDAGRRMTFEAPAEAAQIVAAAASAGVPVRIARAYPGAVPDGPRTPFYWELSRENWADPQTVRGTVAKLAATHAAGFELDLPAGPEGAAAVPALRWGLLGYDPGGR
ncbi:MAG TPA: hypothetical protein VHA11_06100 [Bryobacteraceae bacterium]|nr:hypothetical protein [Bryobacteraceae bacterium]